MPRLRDRLFDPKDAVIFLVVLYATGISVNLLSGLLDTCLKCLPWWVTLAVGGAIPVILFFIIRSEWFRALWPGAKTEPAARVFRAGTCKGLVVIASIKQGIDTARAAIEYHEHDLERIWVLHSDDSSQDAKDLVTDLSRKPRLAADRFRLLHLSNRDFDNPENVRRTIDREVFENLPAGMETSDVLIDITGGLKTTTAGAFLAGLPEGRRLQIVRPLTKDERGRGEKPGVPEEIAIDYRVKPLRRR